MNINSFHETQTVLDNHRDLITELQERVIGLAHHIEMVADKVEHHDKDLTAYRELILDQQKMILNIKDECTEVLRLIKEEVSDVPTL